MKALLCWSLFATSLVCLTGCPEKKPEVGPATQPSASAPAKAPPGGGGW